MAVVRNNLSFDGRQQRSELPQKPFAFEGRSFLNELKGRQEKARPGKPVFWAHGKGKAVRAGEWKLVSGDKGPWELYNVHRDGTELHNLAAKMPDKVAELAELHREWDARTNLAPKKRSSSKKLKKD